MCLCLFLNLILTVLCGKMHPESRQTGVPQPPSPGSKDAADDEREKTCKRQELFQRPGLISKERRKHMFAKIFRTRERHPTDQRKKTTIHPVNYRCVLNHVPRKIQLEWSSELRLSSTSCFLSSSETAEFHAEQMRCEVSKQKEHSNTCQKTQN